RTPTTTPDAPASGHAHLSVVGPGCPANSPFALPGAFGGTEEYRSARTLALTEPARKQLAQALQEVSPEVEKDPLPHHLPGCGGDFGFHRGEKLGEHRLGSPVDHSLADGGQRAADLSIALVLENRLGARFLEIERAGSFDEALLAFAVDDDAVVLGRL